MTIQLTIRKKIMAIALGLIVLMVITAILSFAWVRQVEDRIQALDHSYIPAYGHLARTNIRSLERALAVRRMIIEKMQPSGDDNLAELRAVFESKGAEVEKEAQAARDLINGLIESKKTSPSEAIALARLDDRIATAMTETRRHLNDETGRLIPLLEARDGKGISYAQGLEAYRARRWDEARQAFASALAAVPNDGPSLSLIKRIEAFAAIPPAEGWDGSWRLEQK